MNLKKRTPKLAIFISIFLCVGALLFAGDLKKTLIMHSPDSESSGEPAKTPTVAPAAPETGNTGTQSKSGNFLQSILKIFEVLAKGFLEMVKIFNEAFDNAIDGKTDVPEVSTGNSPTTPEKGKTSETEDKGKSGDTKSGDTKSSDSGDSAGIASKIVDEAKNVVNKYQSTRFPYAAATKGGRLGCAQVVSTVLKAAGVVSSVKLAVVAVVADLKAKGWKDVKVPPFKAGDVITWNTTGKPDSHIGIIMTSGNSVQAMSNSSYLKKPRYHSANYQPITRVLRKV